MSNNNQTQDSHEQQGGVPFFPDHFMKEAAVIALILAIVAFLATLMPMPVGEPADALKTPIGIKPEWYFMTVYQILKYVPRNIGVTFTFLIFPPFMMLFPLFYKSVICKWTYGRLLLHTIGALGIITAIFFTMLAYLGFE
jgi:quinol-cytochrome oxidoreductase complex cytochrome b subunit